MMKTSAIAVFAAGLLLAAAPAPAAPNDSPAALTNAEAQVQKQLDQFATNNADYGLLLDAQTLSACLNPRDGAGQLSKLDADCLRLQLKVLLALDAARDPHYDPDAPTNRVAANLTPPGANGLTYESGINPKDIKEPGVRKAYEAAIAENHRRAEKAKRELALARSEDYAIMDIWIFVKQGFPKNSAAQKTAYGIIQETVTNQTLLHRLESNLMPGLTQ